MLRRLSTPAQEIYIFFFFFQAEDGIRDLYVTGVQTCALPISIPERRTRMRTRPRARPQTRPRPRPRPQTRPQTQIGRASCRERVEIPVGAGSIKKKKKKNNRTRDTERRTM